MVYSRKKKEWESGVEYDKVDLMKDSDLIGCWTFMIALCILGWAIWHFLFTDNRYSLTIYIIIALVFIASVSFIIAKLYEECEEWYVDYEGIHLRTFFWNDKSEEGHMITYKWGNIRNIEFKYVDYANGEYTYKGDDDATYKVIIETFSGEKVSRLIRFSLSDFKSICRKHNGDEHRWFA